MRFAASIHSISNCVQLSMKVLQPKLCQMQTRPSNEKGNQPICKNSVNNNSPKLRFIKLLKPTSISEKTIKSIFFCDVDLPLFTVGDNFELQLIIKSGLKSLILPLFFQSFSISFRVLLVT